MNVRDASADAIAKNEEVQQLKQILGLQHARSTILPRHDQRRVCDQEYSDTCRLRYGHVMLMTDQDYDGSHIKGLILNFLHHCSPSLLKIPKFIQMFITPIIKVAGLLYRLSTSLSFPAGHAWELREGVLHCCGLLRIEAVRWPSVGKLDSEVLQGTGDKYRRRGYGILR